MLSLNASLDKISKYLRYIPASSVSCTCVIPRVPHTPHQLLGRAAGPLLRNVWRSCTAEGKEKKKAFRWIYYGLIWIPLNSPNNVWFFFQRMVEPMITCTFSAARMWRFLHFVIFASDCCKPVCQLVDTWVRVPCTLCSRLKCVVVNVILFSTVPCVLVLKLLFYQLLASIRHQFLLSILFASLFTWFVFVFVPFFSFVFYF